MTGVWVGFHTGLLRRTFQSHRPHKGGEGSGGWGPSPSAPVVPEGLRALRPRLLESRRGNYTPVVLVPGVTNRTSGSPVLRTDCRVLRGCHGSVCVLCVWTRGRKGRDGVKHPTLKPSCVHVTHGGSPQTEWDPKALPTSPVVRGQTRPPQ